jgi:uncharacterized BrkB/YihY/UPF0761 family membrane protein
MNKQQSADRGPARLFSFLLRVVRGFRRNQGLLLSGAVAYYTLLSIVPMSILALIVLSHFMGEEQLFHTLTTYLEMVMPGVRIAFRHALIGGTTATILWEITRSILVWYYAHLSLVNLIYGSIATVVVALLRYKPTSCPHPGIHNIPITLLSCEPYNSPKEPHRMTPKTNLLVNSL